MNPRNSKRILVSFIVACSLAGCEAGVPDGPPAEPTDVQATAPPATAPRKAAPPAGEVKTFHVGPAMADCVGVGPMTCLMVKDAPGGGSKMFYSRIKGFDYVPGFEYELRVEVTRRENVPADASSLSYRLVEVVGKKKAGPALAGAAWKLVSYMGDDGKVTDCPPEGRLSATFGQEKVSGSGGVNNFSGGYELDGTTLKVDALATTMKAGPPEAMKLEQRYLELLAKADKYQIVGEQLRLRSAEGRVVLTFVEPARPGLTSGEWKGTGVNNGKGGVVSAVADAVVTAKFGEDGRLSGSTGCNAYSGKYERDGDALKIGRLMVTRKMCVEPDGVMEQERNYVKALEKVAAIRVADDALELRSASGSLQVRFVKAR